LVEGVSEDVANIVFNKAMHKVIKDAIKHARLVSISAFYTSVLKQEMKPTLAHGIYLTKEQHIQGSVDCLVKDPEAWDWMCGWWASAEFRVISEWYRQNRLSKALVHHYGADSHVRKTQRMV
jgi:hypothetical protein